MGNLHSNSKFDNKDVRSELNVFAMKHVYNAQVRVNRHQENLIYLKRINDEKKRTII